MSRAFGAATLVATFTTVDKTAPPDASGQFPTAQNIVTLPGCRHRPLSFSEVVELGYEVGTELWKSTVPIGLYEAQNSPALSAVYALSARDRLVVDGKKFEVVVAARPHDTLSGRPFKATIISKRQHS